MEHLRIGYAASDTSFGRKKYLKTKFGILVPWICAGLVENWHYLKDMDLFFKGSIPYGTIPNVLPPEGF
jgi:hypothetical protein